MLDGLPGSHCNIFILNFADTRQGVLKSERLVQLITFLMPVSTFEELRLPFACCAVDLHTGEDVIFDRGDLIQALVASASIPGYLSPVELDDRLLIDGAIGQPLPCSVTREMKGEFVIAVDVSLSHFSPLTERHIPGILGRANEISSFKLSQAQKHQCDFLIRPDSLDLHWTQFDQIEVLVAKGEQAVEERLYALRRKLGQARGVKAWLNKMMQRALAS